MNIRQNIEDIKNNLPENVKLVAVSKTRSNEDILGAYSFGCKIFGENKVKELVKKHEELPKDIEWHFIGHLQTNKVKYIAPFVHLIHSIDSLKLLKEINREGLKNKRVISCLLQFYIANEETKFGLSLEKARQILNSEEFVLMQNVKISGVMGMATFTEDTEKIISEFRILKAIFNTLKNEYFYSSEHFCEISMGMSNDFQVALNEGSTIVRIGSKIFET
ncbi:MAG: YggS family pyridoxal phosphate-dependent enzyme [Bacteroidales bacterium]|jgi:pyridoxal phosphate enzyme (YggS family)|nr:YggS family pyridoxal phosphate-dependent enzyme [Bacteroidales bacterium]